MIETLLVANRGEIAVRIMRTARTLGLRTVAVYSDPDADAVHVAAADCAVRLPGSHAIDTYLNSAALLAAAERSGADAIHPGYGFLSESADFARAVQDADLVWIGPPPAAIAAMGSKTRAKAMMAAAGVPVLAELDPATITSADLPVLVKAVAGGGGRGMRVVTALTELAPALAAAGREAAAAFDDAAVFCESYLRVGHHVEVQLLADAHGAVWALGERECSIQRRHQKVIEETPSPLVQQHPGLRDQLFAAAVAAARAVGYQGAGTVEFIVDEDGRFFFLEMNTRLQVEHPVTEAVTGLDLVAEQIAIADGRALTGAAPEPVGHAVQARLYAEDPARDWQPQNGTVGRFRVPDRAGVRVDAGIADGSTVSTFYDPLLAKVICWAPDRRTAVRSLARTLTATELHGLRTNRDLLVRVLQHPEFATRHPDTGFLQRHLPALSAPLLTPDAEDRCAVAAALADAAANRLQAPVLAGLPSGWRSVGSRSQHKRYRSDRREHDVGYRFARSGLIVDDRPGLRLISATPAVVVLECDGLRETYRIGRSADTVEVDSESGSVRLTRIPLLASPEPTPTAGSLTAPMPGSVIAVCVTVGEQVRAGQPLLQLEAMKMQHTVTAPEAGVIRQLPVAAGALVQAGAVLAVLDTTAPQPSGPTDNPPEES